MQLLLLLSCNKFEVQVILLQPQIKSPISPEKENLSKARPDYINNEESAPPLHYQHCRTTKYQPTGTVLTYNPR
jgi:hypothetical protein